MSIAGITVRLWLTVVVEGTRCKSLFHVDDRRVLDLRPRFDVRERGLIAQPKV